MSNDLLHQKITRETQWSIATKAIGMLLFLATHIILARALGPAIYGDWSILLSLANLLGIISFFGINSATRKFAAQNRFSDQLGHYIRSGFMLRAIASAVMALLTYTLTTDLLKQFGLHSGVAAPWLLATFVGLHGLIEFCKAVYFGLHDLKTNFIITALEFGGKFLLSMWILSQIPTLDLLLLGFVISLFSGTFLGAVLLGMKSRGAGPTKHHINEILQLSLPMMIINIGMLAVQEIDILMLGKLATNREVGQYSAAKQIIIKFPHISMAIAAGSMAVFADLNPNNVEKYQAIFKRILKINTWIFLPLIIGFVALGPWLTEWLLGSEFGTAGKVLQVLSMYLLFASFAIIFGQFLDYRGKAMKRALMIIGCLILNVLLNYLLIPIHGAVGAAISTALTFAPYFVICAFETRKVFRDLT